MFGIVLNVQVTPSGEEAPSVPPAVSTVTNIVFWYAALEIGKLPTVTAVKIGALTALDFEIPLATTPRIGIRLSLQLL
jgi:hypothetical protein